MAETRRQFSAEKTAVLRRHLLEHGAFVEPEP
jgi:hypothetical protein